ncbi:MAG: APC family permease [Acidobacteria bacterium]|nr:APC family permease [Acidobacteriota bacterium]MBI3661552.1 APC family permease [Acidobacteriota bacterium]
MPFSLKRMFLGSPLRTAELHEQRLSKRAALAVFASDALSSTAYATEEVLLALVAAGAAFFYLSLPVAICIAALLAIVTTSYSQTIHAYPSGGGAYIVAKENLGVTPGLVAAAALLIDYVLTVAVSVAAGIAAVTSAFPNLLQHREFLCLVAIYIILLANLRGVRESAAVFGVPVYAFIVSAFLLIAGGFFRIFFYGVQPAAAPPAVAPAVPEMGTTWLFLRAFAAGCTALTGVEAISNGVQAFKKPVSRNASITLLWMAGILGTMFLGVTILSRSYGIVPREGETVLSQINQAVFGRGAIYYFIQATTMGILILAANTSFADFPRLSSILAKDRFAPRQLANLGDRLVFSNGVILLSLSASVLIIIFRGDVHALIPLYMVGVFVSFTLSQAGMVVHWLRTRAPGYQWRMAVNGVGAVTTTVVLGVVAIIKFKHGAWVVMLAIALLVTVFRKTREHYFKLSVQISLSDFDRPQVARHTVIVPVAPFPSRVVLTAVEYAKSVSKDVLAVTINTDSHDHEEIRKTWKKHIDDVDLVILESPYRSVVKPLLRFIDEVEDLRSDDKLTVLLPEIVPARWWHNLFHNQTSLLLKGALLFRKNIVVTSVPYHLEK